MKPVIELAARIAANPDLADAELRAFVDGHSFPLVEDDTATFFFWDGQGADQVILLHWVFGLEARQPFDRLEGTDAFFLPLELPHSARVEYKLEVRRGENSRWVRDPLNPRLARDPFGANSVCPMPGYTEPGWTAPAPGDRGGRLERFAIRSAAWGDVREIVVYLPFEYAQDKKYPLLICHDGRDYLRYASMKVVLDKLIQRHEVRPLVVAFTSGSDQRNAEYGANPRQAQFLVDELLPEIEQRYGVSHDPADRGIMGASFGAVASLFAAWTNPGVFGKLLLQSGSFAFTDIGQHDRGPLWDPVVAFVNEFRRDPARLGARLYMSCGTFESLIYYNRSLVPLLRRSGLEVRFVESQDGHNWVSWRDRLREGLTRLYPGHLWMYYE